MIFEGHTLRYNSRWWQTKSHLAVDRTDVL